MVEELLITNLQTGKTLNFDMNKADYLLYEGSIDWGSVDVTHNTFQYPSQVGCYISSTQLGTRDITISGWIVGTKDEILLKKSILSSTINPLQEVKITVGDYAIKGVPAVNVKYSNKYKENNDVACKFSIEIFCNYPLFITKSPTNVSLYSVSGGFRFPLTIPNTGVVMGIRKVSSFTDLQNGGITHVGGIYTLVAQGVVNNPSIINIDTGEFIKINKTLVAGEVVEINTNPGEKSVSGSLSANYVLTNDNRENYLDYLDFDSEWMTIPVGTSTFAVKSYGENGDEDDTYKNLKVTVEYYQCKFNLEEE